MAATGVAAVSKVAVAGMPAPTDCMAPHGSTALLWELPSQHLWELPSQHLWELPWQRQGSRQEGEFQWPACRLPQ